MNKYDSTQKDRVSIFSSLKGSHEPAACGYKVESTEEHGELKAENEWQE